MSEIYFNGKIITMEGRNEEEMLSHTPEAILVDKGIITGTGALGDLEAIAPRSRRIDLDGHCLMPSFIDAHSHIVLNGQMNMCANLSDCKNFKEIITVLKNYISTNRINSSHAVIGFGYDHNFLEEAIHPDKSVLDQVSTKIPIMILHVSAHLACVNSAALNAANVDENTPDPKEGGKIGRIAGSREPNGYLEESAIQPFSELIWKRLKKDTDNPFQKMQDIYLANGITTAQDGASTSSDINTLRTMSSSHQLKLDVVAYPLMTNGGIEIMNQYGDTHRNYNGHFKIGGYKLVLDGSPQGRSAWMSEPYLNGKADYCGYPWMNNETVEKYVLQAVRERRQLLAHCNGDAASEQFLNAYERALCLTGYDDDLRPTMIHCQTVRNDQLDRMADLHMLASIFVGHIWYWGDVHLHNFGTKRGNHISPVKDALNRNIIVNFHQDTPVTKPQMLHSVWCAVNRISRSGHIIGEEQKVSVFDALKAVTINAAYEYFEEDTKGSIRTGKRADLVILDQSPFDVEPMKIKDIQILRTIKDGETVYSLQ